MKKIGALMETTRDRAAATESGSTVFRVPQQQLASDFSAAEEFCVQMHAIG